MSANFLNTINTDFILNINNLPAAVHSKPSCHSKFGNIAKRFKEGTSTKTEMSFAPEGLGVGRGGGGNFGVHRYMKEN